MGLLSSALLAKLREAPQKTVWVLDITLPSGSRKWSLGGFASASAGQYSGIVNKFGEIVRSASDRRNAIERTEVNVSINDKDAVFSSAISGITSTGTLRETVASAIGSPAIIKLGHQEVASSDWFTAFSGMLSKWRNEGSVNWTLTLSNDTKPLTRKSPRRLLSRGDWPRAKDSGVLGRPAPIIYGKHNSQGMGDKGAHACLLVDGGIFRYLVCIGRAKSIDRVYVADEQIYDGFTVSYITNNGVVYTVIDFDEDQLEQQITVDMEGLEEDGDGGGALIENPAEQIRHYLVNFVWNDWIAGDTWYDPSTTPIDETKFDTAVDFCSDQNYKGSRAIITQKNAEDILIEWLRSWEAVAYWTNLGKFAVGFDDHRTTTVHVESPWWKWNIHDVEGKFSQGLEDDSLMDRVSMKYSLLPSSTTYIQELEVRDATIDDESPDSIELAWSPDYII